MAFKIVNGKLVRITSQSDFGTPEQREAGRRITGTLGNITTTAPPPAPPAPEVPVIQESQFGPEAQRLIQAGQLSAPTQRIFQSPDTAIRTGQLQPTAPQFLGPGAAQGVRFQGIAPSAIIPPVQTPRPLSSGPAFDLAPGQVESLRGIISQPPLQAQTFDSRLLQQGRGTNAVFSRKPTLDFLSPGAAQAMRAQGISPRQFIPDVLPSLPPTGEKPIPLGARQALVALQSGQILEPWIPTLLKLGFIEEVDDGQFELTFDGSSVVSGGTRAGSGTSRGPRTSTQLPGGRAPGARAISLGLTNWRI